MTKKSSQDAVEGKGARNWRQTFMYPTVAMALIGALPGYWDQLKAFQAGVSKDELILSQRQSALWNKNFECFHKQLSHAVVTPSRVAVEVTACPSGDVLVRTLRPAREPQYQWLPLPRES